MVSRNSVLYTIGGNNRRYLISPFDTLPKEKAEALCDILLPVVESRLMVEKEIQEGILSESDGDLICSGIGKVIANISKRNFANSHNIYPYYRAILDQVIALQLKGV